MATRDIRPCPGSASLHPGAPPGSRVPSKAPGATSAPAEPPGASRVPRARRRLRNSSGARSPPGERRPEGHSSPIVLLQDVTNVTNVTAAPGALPSLRDKPKTIRVITRDVIRELIIPRDRPPGSLIIGNEEFQRIQDEAQPPRPLADPPQILKSRQDTAFISGSSCPITQLQDVRSAPGPVPQDKPKTIRVFTKDVVRDLVIPRDRPPGSLVLGNEEFQRIQDEAQPPRPLADPPQILKSRQDAAFEARSRARSAERRQEEQREAREPSELGLQLELERRELLERAAGLRLEQEDEMRRLNSLLLSARCRSIQDRQLAEKQQLQGELQAEEQRLVRLLDSEREKELQMEEELQRRRKQEIISHKLEVLKQVEQHQEQRALKAEQKLQERQRLLEHLEQMKREDHEAWQQRQQRKQQLMAEMRAVDAENQRLRQRERERDRRAELRALEEQRLKGEREVALQAERARLCQEQQRELDRLKAAKEREREWQEAQGAVTSPGLCGPRAARWRQSAPVSPEDALRSKRSQQVAEREWQPWELSL
ncbi:cilia- and flagella-associated protein 45 [Ammospiza caudacuta]|uniref:cilia- and flagella-associated protein 45 n=1 Tax=Ammospiza caudacuta TaxID=2857398 RepID=UPI002738BFC8|nr:cilia- and flagella-associated protein 45 [Ammospiza caudacuta]